MKKQMSLLVSIVLVACFGFAAGKTADTPAAKPTVNAVRFTEPLNGAKVPTKFKVKMAVEGYQIGPVGDLTKGKGHHHLIVNGGPIAEGQVVPADAKHIHFGKGQTETELELTPGKHKITLQFADGAHRSYGPALSQTIEVDVK